MTRAIAPLRLASKSGRASRVSRRRLKPLRGVEAASRVGLSGDGVTRANAVSFTGGVNALELQAGSTITGNVVAFSAADTFRLGGTTSAAFDVLQISLSLSLSLSLARATAV